MKWIEAHERGTSPSGKTLIWSIESHGGALLGQVRWYGPWRKYCYFPADGFSVLEEDCLSDISDFIVKRTDEHKDKPRKFLTSHP